MDIEPSKKRNYIFIANGIEPSLKGFLLDGWEVKTIHKKPLENELQGQIGESLFKALKQAEKHPETFMSGYQQVDIVDTNILNNKELIRDCMKKNNYDEIINQFYVFLEKNTTKDYEIYPIISTLRLFKTSRLGLYYPLSYDNSGKIVSEIVFGYPSSIMESSEIKNFALDEQEQIKIKEFYDKVLYYLNNPTIQTMIEIFNTSYSVMNTNIGFIMRVTILEMLIDGNAEMTYKLSRSVAVLLGKTKEKSEDIFKKCKKIYEARSKYLHEGKTKKITSGNQFLALDYSRRVIANLIDIFYEKQIDITTIRVALNEAGFGDNPFNVKF